MEENFQKNDSSEKSIDLVELLKLLFNNKKLILKCGAIGIVVGLIIAFSIPKEYTTTVVLAPDANAGNSMNGGAGALAAMAGVSLGSNGSSVDLSSDVYPDIMGSTPFILGLSNVKVLDPQEGIDTTLFAYIKDDQRNPWWSVIIGLPFKVISLFSSKEEDVANGERNRLVLSKQELDVVKELQQRETVSIDKKTGVITLTSTMQSPVVSAIIADTLTSYLQDYIIKYRTQKARADLAFAEKLYNEAKIDYNKSQQKYADYLDRNQNVISASYRVNQEKLQNEVALAYSVYNQVAQQLQLAKVKVQDQTPVYSIIQPAIIPLNASAPNKKLIIIGLAILFSMGASAYIIGKDYLKK